MVSCPSPGAKGWMVPGAAQKPQRWGAVPAWIGMRKAAAGVKKNEADGISAYQENR